MFSWPWNVQKNKHHLYYAIVVGFILFVAAFTRLWQLGTLPTGITWDEAALGYIGKMVITTGMDEHFDRLPIAFQSFGDYKAPLAMYITGVFTTLFGMSAWVVRLPYALAGIASVGVFMWMLWRLTEHKWHAALGGWLFAIAPWHLLISRVGFESGMALLCLLIILTGWLEVRRTNTNTLLKKIWWGAIVVSTVASLYVYHSTKVVVPLTGAVIAVYEYFSQRKYWHSQWKTLGIVGICTGVLLLPFIYTLLDGTGIARASQTTVFSRYGWGTGLKTLLTNLGTYFSVEFLVRGATDNLRHSTGSRGVFLWSQLLLFLLGITFGITRPLERWVKPRKASLLRRLSTLFSHTSATTHLSTPVWIWVVLLCIGLLPAAIGVETPHANRALLALPAFLILMVLGARELQRELNGQLFVSVLSGILLLSIIEWASFWSFYTTEYRLRSSADWMEGYEEVVRLTHTYIAENKRTKFTDAYGEPAIFFAFYNQIPFETYRAFRVPGSVTFGTVSALDADTYDILISPGDEPPLDRHPDAPLKLIHTVTRSNNSPAFYIYETR